MNAWIYTHPSSRAPSNPTGTTVFLRRGIEAEWLAVDPVLACDEIVYVTDKGWLKIGDGERPFSELPYYRPEDR